MVNFYALWVQFSVLVSFIHTHTHTHTHTYIHTHTHTHKHAHMPTRAHTHTFTHSYTRPCTAFIMHLQYCKTWGMGLCRTISTMTYYAKTTQYESNIATTQIATTSSYCIFSSRWCVSAYDDVWLVVLLVQGVGKWQSYFQPVCPSWQETFLLVKGWGLGTRLGSWEGMEIYSACKTRIHSLVPWPLPAFGLGQRLQKWNARLTLKYVHTPLSHWLNGRQV